MGGGLMSSAIIGKALLGMMKLSNAVEDNIIPEITSYFGNKLFNYYPDVIKAILEFRAISDIQGQEFDSLAVEVEDILSDSYLSTMLDDRIVQWENLLGITPLTGTTLEDRRETIIARVRGQGKLNTNLINSIVSTFTGGTANSWIKDSVLYVEITPPKNNKQYVFENVENELKLKVPAHLGCQVSRNYITWDELAKSYQTWNDVKDSFTTWADVTIMSPFK